MELLWILVYNSHIARRPLKLWLVSHLHQDFAKSIAFTIPDYRTAFAVPFQLVADDPTHLKIEIV